MNEYEIRRRHRASLREDLARVIAEISALQDPEAPDELCVLAESVCASHPESQTPKEVREWARWLSVDIID